MAIKNHEVFQIINDISESISLTYKHNLIIEAALDSVSKNLNADCSWIQLADAASNKVTLVSSRNFSQDINHEISMMDTNHYFIKEVVGLGNKVMVPNLSRDGKYGISVFEKAGYSSVIAVPITTYKILGIMGLSFRNRKKFSNDFVSLLSVIANLLGMALNKAIISELILKPEDEQQNDSSPYIQTCLNQDSEGQIANEDEAFNDHNNRMGTFRKLHK